MYMRVAIVAPPWLALPIKGYGGIELVLEGLIDGLRAQGVEVEVFGNGARKIRGVKTHSLYKEEQFQHIHLPYYESAPIVQAHITFALNKIREDGNFDIIHDHNTLIGPSFFALASQLKDVPPVLHTFHGPPFTEAKYATNDVINNRTHLEQMSDMGKMYMVCISDAMSKTAPVSLRPHLLKAVHNAIEVDHFPFKEKKRDYFITLARFTPEKGQAVAAKLAARQKKKLKMAGTVAGLGSKSRLTLELSNPLSQFRANHEFRYFSDEILRYTIRYPYISYVGTVSGVKKMNFISNAKALLFPIDWEEPFGMAVIEALACGTPVIAMKRGAMPEIIEHGVTGFLANNEEEFSEYMKRIDEIDPVNCRQSVIDRFGADAMAKSYIERYKEVIKLSKKRN
jgi:glycosyltransferase involved in cell wall biosynthesis